MRVEDCLNCDMFESSADGTERDFIIYCYGGAHGIHPI